MNKNNLSNVSVSSRHKKLIHVAMALFAVVLIFFMLLTGLSSKQQKKVASRSDEAAQYSEELTNNLNELNQLEKQVKKSEHNHQKTEKLLLARQNAPMNMFSIGSNRLNNHSSATSLKNSMDFNNSQSVHYAQTIANPERTIVAGEMIHAVLETAIDSSLPGMIRAIISAPVYSYKNNQILIPEGSRLVGQYVSSINQGQSRVFVIWNRIITPDGLSIQLDSPGVDVLGRAGQAADAIDTHFLQRFGQATLLSIIGAGVATYDVDTNEQNNSASRYRSAIAQSFQSSANKSLNSSSSIAPTLHIHQGHQINVFVAHDLEIDD